MLLDRVCTYYTLAGSLQASRPISMVSPGPRISANVLRKPAASARSKFPGNVSVLNSQVGRKPTHRHWSRGSGCTSASWHWMGSLASSARHRKSQASRGRGRVCRGEAGQECARALVGTGPVRSNRHSWQHPREPAEVGSLFEGC